MRDIAQLLERWQLDVGNLRESMYGAPTPRERERWHGLWLLAQGWSAIQVAEALERESLIPLETGWPTFAEPGPKVWSLNRLGVPPVLSRGEQNHLKSSVLDPPGEAGIELSNWNWKVVRQFLKRSFDLGLSRSSCLNYLHRLGFVLKRPKKRLLKAKDEERKAFVLQYRQIREEAQVLLRGRSPLSGRCRPEGQMGVARSACFGGLHQSPVGREGQLLLGSLSGEWGGGSHGDSWKQHCRDLHRLFTAAKRKPSWTSGSDLGQWASPPR